LSVLIVTKKKALHRTFGDENATPNSRIGLTQHKALLSSVCVLAAIMKLRVHFQKVERLEDFDREESIVVIEKRICEAFAVEGNHADYGFQVCRSSHTTGTPL
jgi:hypothetical protein